MSTRESMTHDAFLRPSKRRVGPYLGWVLALSVPFWIVGSSPTALRSLTHADVPLSTLMFICPTAAVCVVLRNTDRALRRSWFASAVRLPRSPRIGWVLVAMLGMPAVFALAWLVQRLADPDLPAPRITPTALIVAVGVYFAAAVVEEMGWSAYATEPLLARYSPLTASAILGSAWALWHVIPYVQGGLSFTWIVGQCLFTVALRSLIVLVYSNNGQTMLWGAMTHGASNIAWAAFPVAGSQYNPWVAACLTAVLCILLRRLSLI